MSYRRTFSKEASVPTIAMADSQQMFRSSIKAQLSSFGYEVYLEAASGEELIHSLEACSVLPDICLLDIDIRPLNGIQAASVIQRRWPTVRIIALTAIFDDWYIARMVTAGARAYILKSESLDELRKAIHAVHTHGIFFSRALTARLYKRIRANQVSLPRLSALERAVLCYCCTDLSYEAIGALLKTTKRSVESARDRLFEKFAVCSRVGLALFAVRLGYVQPEAADQLSLQKIRGQIADPLLL